MDVQRTRPKSEVATAPREEQTQTASCYAQMPTSTSSTDRDVKVLLDLLPVVYVRSSSWRAASLSWHAFAKGLAKLSIFLEQNPGRFA